MQKINASQIKRDCFIALLLPVAMLSLIHLGVKRDWSASLMIFTAFLGLFVLGYYLYQFFIRLENLLWHEHLISLIKKISTPVLLADENHNILFMNDSFHRVSFLATILKYQNLPDLLTRQNTHSDHDAYAYDINEQTTMLDKLTYKIKIHFTIKDQNYQWILIPIFSPLGKRWGTLVECVLNEDAKERLKTQMESFPFANVLDQLPVPVMLVGKNERVLYVNLSLKMVLVRHQGLIQSLCPTWDLYDPIGDTLNHFLKLAQVKDQSFQSLVNSGSGVVQLRDECFQLTVQNVLGDSFDSLGTLVLWQEKQEAFDPILEDR